MYQNSLVGRSPYMPYQATGWQNHAFKKIPGYYSAPPPPPNPGGKPCYASPRIGIWGGTPPRIGGVGGAE